MSTRAADLKIAFGVMLKNTPTYSTSENLLQQYCTIKAGESVYHVYKLVKGQ